MGSLSLWLSLELWELCCRLKLNFDSNISIDTENPFFLFTLLNKKEENIPSENIFLFLVFHRKKNQ